MIGKQRGSPAGHVPIEHSGGAFRGTHFVRSVRGTAARGLTAGEREGSEGQRHQREGQCFHSRCVFCLVWDVERSRGMRLMDRNLRPRRKLRSASLRKDSAFSPLLNAAVCRRGVVPSRQETSVFPNPRRLRSRTPQALLVVRKSLTPRGGTAPCPPYPPRSIQPFPPW